jgi:4-hydroxy-4-methyl-2-oxoglutarate aldolase
VPDLSGLDACAVSDALDSLELGGVLPELRPLWPCPPLCGRVITVQLVDAEAAPARKVHLGAAAITIAEPGEVVVVDNRGRTDCGAWGGLLSQAAVMRGVAGVVLNGACRDIDQAQQLGFPVFGLAGTPRTARGRVVEESTGAELSIGDVRVATGDLLVADASGVVVVAAARADEVVARARELGAREAAMAERLRAGDSVADVLGARYEQMLSDRA